MIAVDKAFEAFKQLVPYLRGALWWGRNDLIKSRQPQFNQRGEHIGHPLLSVRNAPVENRFDMLPMLVGTSGTRMNDNTKCKCVIVTGMTKSDSEHKTYFGSIVMPGSYSFSELMDSVRSHKGDYTVHEYDTQRNCKCAEKGVILRSAWHQSRTMYPNEDKKMVSESEMQELNRWCNLHHL